MLSTGAAKLALELKKKKKKKKKSLMMKAEEGGGEGGESRLDHLKSQDAPTASENGSIRDGWFAELSEMWPGQVKSFFCFVFPPNLVSSFLLLRFGSSTFSLSLSLFLFLKFDF